MDSTNEQGLWAKERPFYVSYAIPLVRPGFLSSELELPFQLLVLYSIGGIICSRAGISSSMPCSMPCSRANLSTYVKVIEYKSQNSDKCAALTNHLPLLKKEMFNFLIYFQLPLGESNPGLSGGSQVYLPLD